MTTRAGAACALLLAMSIGVPGEARAGDAAERYAAWRACLHRAFVVETARTARIRAADASLRACEAVETAYLTALSTSPLLDGDDVARVRPALIQRARGWLLAGGPRPL